MPAKRLRSRHKRRWIGLAGLLAVSLVLLLGACGGSAGDHKTSQPQRTGGPATTPASDIGRPVSIGGGVTVTVMGVKVYPLPADMAAQFGQPDDLYVDLMVANHGRQAYQVNVLSFQALDQTNGQMLEPGPDPRAETQGVIPEGAQGIYDFGGPSAVVPVGAQVHGGVLFLFTAGQRHSYSMANTDRSMQTTMAPLPTWNLGVR